VIVLTPVFGAAAGVGNSWRGLWRTWSERKP